jgi:hypothetical protein
VVILRKILTFNLIGVTVKASNLFQKYVTKEARAELMLFEKEQAGSGKFSNSQGYSARRFGFSGYCFTGAK